MSANAEASLVELVGGPLCGLVVRVEFPAPGLHLPVPGIATTPNENSNYISGIAEYRIDWLTPAAGKGLFEKFFPASAAEL
jgi:hypothetical protein